MTRHRERLDVYVDRKPVELDVRNRRNEETAGDPVSNAEILGISRAQLVAQVGGRRPPRTT